MKISEYTRALNRLDERQLDTLFAAHTKNSVVFQPALAPPEKWKRARGSISGHPERASAEKALPYDTRRNIDISRVGAPPLASRLFLAGFVKDLAQEFGEHITADCINAHRLGNDTPITARTVKEIISEAVQARMRQINDGHLRAFLANSTWIDLPPPALQLAPRTIHDTPQNLEALRGNAARFVIGLVSSRCQSRPDYGVKPLDFSVFVETANAARALVEQIRTLPMMTAHALEMTLERFNADLANTGAKDTTDATDATDTLSALHIHAATACIEDDTASDDPASLLSLGARSAQIDFRLPPFSEIALARIQHEFPQKFQEDIKHCTALASEPISGIFPKMRVLAQATLNTMFENYGRLYHRIDNAPHYSPRQKTMMRQWLEIGGLTPAQTEACVAASLWMKESFTVNILPALNSAQAAGIIAEHLTSFAQGLEDETRERIDASLANTPGAQHGARHFDGVLKTLCSMHTALGVSGLTPLEAHTLLRALNGETGKRMARLLPQADPVTALAYRTLSEALLRRSLEVCDHFHGLMVAGISTAIRHAQQPEALTRLPGGHAIATAFWEAVRDATLTLKDGSAAPLIDNQGWAQLDDASKMQRLEAGYVNMLASMFNGDADKASAFTLCTMALEPAILALCKSSPALNPIHLADGTPIVNFLPAGGRRQEIVLNAGKHGHLQLVSTLRIEAPRGAVDAHGNVFWLAWDASFLELRCALILTRSGEYVLREPMCCLSQLMLSDWPKTDYPEPIPDDLHTPEYTAQEDLIAFAMRSQHAEPLDVLLALEALHAFRRAPSLESALSIHETYVASGALQCLGESFLVSTPSTQEMLLRTNAAPVVPILRQLLHVLEKNLDHWHQRSDRDLMTNLRNRLTVLIADPTIEDFRALNEALFARNDASAELRQAIPPEHLRQLHTWLDRALHPVDASFFSALENEIIRFAAEEILPAFIAAVREASAPEH